MIDLAMSFEWRRKVSYEREQAAEGRGFADVLKNGIEIFAALTGKRANKVEQGFHAAVASASSKALEARSRGEVVGGREFFINIVSNLPPEQFPGIKNLQEKDPAAIGELVGELFDVAKTADEGERNLRIDQTLGKYNAEGVAREEMRQLLNLTSRFSSIPEGEVSPQNLESWRAAAADAGAHKGGSKEKFFSVGGLLGLLFLLNAFVIFAQYKLMKFALEKGAGVKRREKK